MSDGTPRGQEAAAINENAVRAKISAKNIIIRTKPAAAAAPPAAPKGEKGEGGGAAPAALPRVTNAEFVAWAIQHLPDGAVGAVCSKPGNPEDGGWFACAANDVDAQCPPNRNNYINNSSFMRTLPAGCARRRSSLRRSTS